MRTVTPALTLNLTLTDAMRMISKLRSNKVVGVTEARFVKFQSLCS